MLINIKKYIVFIFLISFVSIDICANDNEVIIEKGQKWVLESRSNKLSSATSKVLYFFSTDAYNTYYARIFSDWNSFSVIDSRNLVRLNTGDQIEVIKPVHQAKVYEVKLLSGYEKNRKYFVIKDDLINDYILSKDKDEI